MRASSRYSAGVLGRVATLVVGCGLVVALMTNTVSGVGDIRTEIRTVASISVSSRTVGISDNDLYFSYSDSSAVSKHLSTIKALGVRTVRLAVPWAAYEPAKGTFSWAALDAVVSAASANGLGVLGVVNTTPAWPAPRTPSLYTPPTSPADLGTFMGALAKRYVSKMTAFEVWNEPNAATSYAPAPRPGRLRSPAQGGLPGDQERPSRGRPSSAGPGLDGHVGELDAQPRRLRPADVRSRRGRVLRCSLVPPLSVLDEVLPGRIPRELAAQTR